MNEVHDYENKRISWFIVVRQLVVNKEGWRMVPGKFRVSENFVPISKSQMRFE